MSTEHPNPQQPIQHSPLTGIVPARQVALDFALRATGGRVASSSYDEWFAAAERIRAYLEGAPVAGSQETTGEEQ